MFLDIVKALLSHRSNIPIFYRLLGKLEVELEQEKKNVKIFFFHLVLYVVIVLYVKVLFFYILFSEIL